MQTETVTNTGLNYWDDEKLVKRFFDKVNKTEGCWEWTAFCWESGYGCFSITHSDNQRAHRVSYEIYHKRNILPDMLILHSCNNRKCVNPQHLREGTHQENMLDRTNAGHNATNITSSLTENDVINIREMAKTFKQKDIAELYGITRHSVRNIVNRFTWKHIL
jgi:hypothetical protein